MLQIVNDKFLQHVREKRVSYVRGDTLDIQEDGVRVNLRQRGSEPKDPGEEKFFNADVIVFATGYEKPIIDFLPKDLFPEAYEVVHFISFCVGPATHDTHHSGQICTCRTSPRRTGPS